MASTFWCVYCVIQHTVQENVPSAHWVRDRGRRTVAAIRRTEPERAGRVSIVMSEDAITEYLLQPAQASVSAQVGG